MEVPCVLKEIFKRLFDLSVKQPRFFNKAGFLFRAGERTIPLFVRCDRKGESDKMKHNKVRRLVSISMLSSIAFILMMLSFPILGAFPYLKIDFSDIPALLAVILYGPGAGIAVEAIKNVLNYFIAGSASGVPIDQTANFIAGTLFILPAAVLLKKSSSAKGFVTALFAGTVVMAVSMSILNYLLFLPAYTWFLNAPLLSGEALKTTVLAGILPFNFIKGIAVALVSTPIFLSLKPRLKETVRMAK